LKYQSLTLEEKVARFENMEAELVKLQLENQVCIEWTNYVCIKYCVCEFVGIEKEIGSVVWLKFGS